MALVAAALCAGPSTVRVAGAEEPSAAWTVALDSEFGWQQSTPEGVLVVATSTGIVGLDGAKGGTLWRIPDLRRPGDESLVVLPRQPYGLLRLKPGVRGDTLGLVIDLTTGKEAWSTATLGLPSPDRQLYVPALDALLVSSRSGKRAIAVLADLSTGRQIRTYEGPEKGLGPNLREFPLLDTDSTLVIAAEKGLVKYNLATGALVWTTPALKDGKQKPCAAAASAPPNTERKDPRPLPPLTALQVSSDGRHLYVVHGSTLHLVDALDGHPIWHEPHELCGRCVAVLEVDGGLIVWTMPEVVGADELVMLDGATGAVRWQYPRVNRSLGALFKALANPRSALGDPVTNGGTVYAFSGKDLISIDVGTGESAKFAKAQWSEEAGAPSLERLRDGWLAAGQQDLEWFDAQGNSVRHVHYDPPHDVGGALVWLGVGLALNSIGTMHAGQGGTIKFGSDYSQVFESFQHGFHSSSRVDSLRFMLADLEDADMKGPALVAMDEETGEVRRRIPVTVKLHYVMDAVNARVFVERYNTIRCYGL